MNIGIQTWGSNGDIRPLIAFGAELVKHGHNLTISIFSVDNKDYTEVCKKNNLNYIKIPNGKNSHFEYILHKIGGNKNSVKIMNILLNKAFFPYIDEIYQNSCYLAKNNDILISHFLMYPLKVASKKYNKKHLTVFYWTGFLKTKHQAPYPFKSKNTIINKLLWKVFDLVFSFLLKKKEINKLYKKELNMKVKSSLDACFSDEINLIASSPAIWEAFDDWDSKHKVIGSWELDVKIDINHEEQKITEFINNGRPNIFMSLGSPNQIDLEKSTNLLIDTAKKLNANVFLQTSSKKYKNYQVEGNILFFDNLPHGVILKYCDVAIHHGGAGTSQTVIKYGVPAIVIAFSDEQMNWGEQIYKLVLGEKPMRYSKAKSEKIVEGIEKILADKKYKKNAEIYSKKIKNENGLLNGIKIIENLF